MANLNNDIIKKLEKYAKKRLIPGTLERVKRECGNDAYLLYLLIVYQANDDGTFKLENIKREFLS